MSTFYPEMGLVVVEGRILPPRTTSNNISSTNDLVTKERVREGDILPLVLIDGFT